MRILILNQYFPPDSSATAEMLALVAEALARRHDVAVIAGRPSYDPRARDPYYLLRRQRRGNLTIERVGSTAFDRRSMAGRIANFLTYLTLAFVRAIAIRPRPDVIIAMTDPPLASVPGALASMLRGSRFVYNIRDFHPDMAIASGVLKRGMAVSLWDRLHRWVLRRADLVIVLGEDMRERAVVKGAASRRVKVVRDGAAPLASRSHLDPRVTREIRSGFEFVVVHAGNLGFAGCWQTLITAASALQDDGVGMVFVGEGALREDLEKNGNGHPNVRFLPFYPAAKLAEVLAAGDLQIVAIRRGLEGLVVPSKMYPLLAAGRPILAVAPSKSDVARIVTRYECGLVADPDKPEEVASAIRFARSKPELLSAMGSRAREAAHDFGREKELGRFMEFVEEVYTG